MVTSQPGRSVVRRLEAGLKDADLTSLRRLLVVQICNAADWGRDDQPPGAPPGEIEGSYTERVARHPRWGGGAGGSAFAFLHFPSLSKSPHPPPSDT